MRTFIALLLVSASAVSVKPHNRVDKQPITISISAESPTAKAGSDVHITVKLTNNSKHDIDASGSWSSTTNVDPNYTFDIRDSDGNPAPKRTYSYPESAFGHAVFRTVQPTKSITDTPNLSRLFDLTRPSKYTPQVSRPIPKALGGGVVKSNIITITITDKPEDTAPKH